MIKFICPVCKCVLSKKDNALVCENNHSYDIAKQGYVNLLQSQKSSKKRHGDDKLMIKARRDFLDGGFYEPLLNGICTAVADNAESTYFSLLDCGCGECYYTSDIKHRFSNADIYGTDISKEALIFGAKRTKDIHLAAASSSNLPVGNNSFNFLLSIFAPVFPDEFSRVLKSGGILIRAVPLENHLLGLKRAIYDIPYKNKAEDLTLSGFRLIENNEIKYTLELEHSTDIMNLFKMTPYFYKTSRTDQEKIEKLDYLKTEIEFAVLVYKTC
ncbi:MAG: methyltransferase domain-containing protein [Clostridia bacterium]|nr:methyltransferase domain-containing protein [Clostridia bacterium]